MLIRIETTSGVPITRQVMDQIRAEIGSGALSPGARLPSVRILARELAINQNTVLRVYERLTAEGLLERRHGNGTFVAKRMPVSRMKQEVKQIYGQIERLARRAMDLGGDDQRLREAIERALSPERNR